MLWGKGVSDICHDALQIEAAIIEQHAELAAGLVKQNVERRYRSLRLKIPDLQERFVAQDVIQLSFHLPAGSYATAVLREMVTWD